ncbi:hypothetical protein ACFPRL_30305 [Pseudoclavibacter helvolus]
MRSGAPCSRSVPTQGARASRTSTRLSCVAHGTPRPSRRAVLRAAASAEPRPPQADHHEEPRTAA